jgi:hypothetical protein
MYVLAEFQERESVVTAIRRLRTAGIGPEDLELFSEEPVELPKGVLDLPSRMSLTAVTGAIAFGLLATGFIAWAQHNYKVSTGGMPLFSFWATGVITYEMTMLGAIVATFACFLWESGLIRKHRGEAPVPEVAPGSMCLRVRCDARQADRAAETIRAAGGATIDRRGNA